MTSNETLLELNSEKLLNSTLNDSHSCTKSLCKIGFFFELWYYDYDYIGRLLEAKIRDPNILFLDDATPTPMSVYILVSALFHKGKTTTIIYTASPWMGVNDTLSYLQLQIETYANVNQLLNTTKFYSLVNDYVLGYNEEENIKNGSYVAYIADGNPEELAKQIKEQTSKPVSMSHNIDIVLLDTYRHNLNLSLIYKDITDNFLVLKDSRSKKLGNHVLAVNNSLNEFSWMLKYGILSSKAAGGSLRSIPMPPKRSHLGVILGSVFGGLALVGIIVVGVFICNRKKKRRKQVERIHSMNVVEEDILDDFRIGAEEIEIDYNQIIGKGSTSYVYKALLKRTAPIHQMLNTIKTSKFANCPVAVKLHGSSNSK
ncbi:hypothetical protein L596_010656 [Steinernema carpocapsae]|uniref:Uncharacterized protein n=1 Tax=Steinernema carpocapsae TaxID=34508 RepID=A0A4U5PJQ0_STECR|nr:hypothetical protein L596_010656 [Steinernema carpocapsae]